MHNCSSCNRLVLEETQSCPFCETNQRKTFTIPRSIKLLGASATMFVMAACYGSGPMAYKDVDGDGHTFSTDCDDNNPAANPDHPEICTDGFDNDCDGAIDAADSDCTVETKKPAEKKKITPEKK